ncbi:Pex19 protein [Rhodocollybia butyracea]|uniref:Pex19 protein n=1 Tax=Rhodocollybia butyracea TaxID=206335 RepID=A0A9P5U708_9AGAR|nr:Pex19 protein [Rhodocollybia butyracea]
MKELAEEGKVSEEEIVEKDDLGAQTEEESKQKESERLMKAAWEAMLIEGMNGMTEDPVSAASTSKDTNDFQSKIKQTMDKLKKSEDNLKTSSSSTGSGGPETLQGLLDSLKDLGLDDLGGEGEEDEAELAGFLENMMGQLMGKEVLYEPLKELNDKFPDYLQNPPTPLSTADKERYSKQYEYVQQILAIFEEPGYDENNQTTGAKVAELMGEMQNYGAPPESIMGPMPPMPDGGCVVL